MWFGVKGAGSRKYEEDADEKDNGNSSLCDIRDNRNLSDRLSWKNGQVFGMCHQSGAGGRYYGGARGGGRFN